MKVFDVFNETRHKELGILRIITIILGFFISVAYVLLLGGLILSLLLMFLLAASMGETGFQYLPPNLNFYSCFIFLFLMLGMMLMEIYSIFKMGKKKSKIFSFSMIFIALFYLFSSFNISAEIIDIFAKYPAAEGLAVVMTFLLFLIPLGLSICFFITGVIHNKSNIKQSTYRKIGLTIILLMIAENIVKGTGVVNAIMWICMFSPMLLYIIFYPKGYIMPKYQKACEDASTKSSQGTVVLKSIPADNAQKNRDSMVEELERLKVLLDSGAISQEEFSKLKSSIINIE